jgi:antitoxin PrlF
MPSPAKSAVSARAKVTSKGQVTIPASIRKTLGVRTGDHLRFEQHADGIKLVHDGAQNPFKKWRGIGAFPGMGKGREAIVSYFRELRGHDNLD